MNLIDLLDPDFDGAMARDIAAIRDGHSAPCEDDCETLLRSLYTCPDESAHEGGSPLNFRPSRHRMDDSTFNSVERPDDIDRQIQKAMIEGLEAEDRARNFYGDAYLARFAKDL